MDNSSLHDIIISGSDLDDVEGITIKGGFCTSKRHNTVRNNEVGPKMEIEFPINPTGNNKIINRKEIPNKVREIVYSQKVKVREIVYSKKGHAMSNTSTTLNFVENIPIGINPLVSRENLSKH